MEHDKISVWKNYNENKNLEEKILFPERYFELALTRLSNF